MEELSIICCWNNKEQFEGLIDGLQNQTIVPEIIGINNSGNRFSSCSAALNSVIDSIKTKYVIYIHQDIRFVTTTTIEEILNYLYKIKENDILGVVGAFNSKNLVKTNIYIGKNLHYGSDSRLKGIEECFSLDECLFGGLTSRFRKYKFDEEVCNNWHLYAVDQCLYNIIYGYKVYACDVTLIHISEGTINQIYNTGFRDLCKKYANSLKKIYTPCCYASNTNFVSRWIYFIKNSIRIKVQNE